MTPVGYPGSLLIAYLTLNTVKSNNILMVIYISLSKVEPSQAKPPKMDSLYRGSLLQGSPACVDDGYPEADIQPTKLRPSVYWIWNCSFIGSGTDQIFKLERALLSLVMVSDEDMTHYNESFGLTTMSHLVMFRTREIRCHGTTTKNNSTDNWM